MVYWLPRVKSYLKYVRPGGQKIVLNVLVLLKKNDQNKYQTVFITVKKGQQFSNDFIYEKGPFFTTRCHKLEILP